MPPDGLHREATRHEAIRREPMRHETPTTGRRPVSRWAVVAVGAIALGAVALIAFSLTRPEPPGFVPTPEAVPHETGDGSFRLTVDASDEHAWRFVSLGRGTTVSSTEPWDLAVRRFHIIANGGAGFRGAGAIADLDATPFEAAIVPDGAAFRATEAGRDSLNPAIARWYRYGFTSHLLTPLDRTWVVRGGDGAHYALRILGYYCPGARPGCVTFRYRPL